jgi:hypothetical protein
VRERAGCEPEVGLILFPRFPCLVEENELRDEIRDTGRIVVNGCRKRAPDPAVASKDPVAGLPRLAKHVETPAVSRLVAAQV